MITQERLKELLDYNPETGVFVWKDGRGRGMAGKEAGWVNNEGYKHITINSKTYKAHRLAWQYVYGEEPPDMLDHINMDRADNRLCNLRLATREENRHNMGVQKNNTSGFKGVSFHKGTGRWVARINIKGIAKSLGYYDTPEEASEFYELVAETIRGDFHRKAA